MSYRDARDFFNLSEFYTASELNDSYQKLLKEKPVINIDLMYSILLNELNKRVLKEELLNFQNNINKLKEKYQSTKIVYLCNSFLSRLKKVTSIDEVNSLKDDFNKRVGILKSQIIVPNEKVKIIEEIKKYLIGASINLKNIVLEYSDSIASCSTLEEINSTKQKYDKLLKNELREEKLREKGLDDLRNSLKRAQIYNFYNISKAMQISDIINAHNLLINILELITLVNFDNKDFICQLIEEMDYNNIENSFNKIDLYLKSNNLKLNSFTNDTVFLSDKEINSDLISLILDKYYLYATKKKETIDKLINDKDNFKDLFVLINNTSKELLDKLLIFGTNLSYKNLKLLIEGLDDFKEPEKIYIERTTGKLCIFKETSKKIYTIFKDGEIREDLNSANDIKWKYISLLKFLNLAEFTNGYEINKVNNGDVVPFNDYNTNYLYYTNELILSLVDDGEKQEFIFIPNLDDSRFILSENPQIIRNSYFELYQNKNKCLNDLILNNENEKIKEGKSI